MKNYQCSIKLLLPVLLFCVQNLSAIEDGTFHCIPNHSVHYLQLEDGEAKELIVSNENARIIITINKDNIFLDDSRVTSGKTIDIVQNVVEGPVTGQTGSRQFYMDAGLHYFYGAVDESGVAAYAEDGWCRRN